jgi:hypothetical protein
VTARLEAAVRKELEQGEALEATAQGIVSRWIPLSMLGELFAQPAVVALTSRRVAVFEVARFSNEITRVIFSASRREVGARLKRRSGPNLFLERRSSLTLSSRERSLRVYIDPAWRNQARSIAEVIGAGGR